MARDFFKPLSEYLKASQKEWMFRSKQEEDDPETVRQEEYHAGIAEFEGARYEEAIEHLKKATESKQYKKDAYYYLAECYAHLNLIPLARKTYERLMRMDYHYRDIQAKIRELDAPRPSKSPASGQSEIPGNRQTTQVMPSEDRYHILSTLHESLSTRIYRVKDNLLGRIIALKQIDPNYPERIAYLQAMKACTVMDHPNIVRVYDIHEPQGQIAMEYVEGQNLRQILRLKGALAPKVATYVAVQIVNGLHYAHAHNIFHQALTPEHILLTRQCALKITAFRSPNSFLALQKTDDPYKYIYIPPEVFQHKEVTAASNVYSFGVIMYEIFVGRPPFTIQQIKAFLKQHEALSLDLAPLPEGIAPILKRCLSVAPEERCPDIGAVGEAFVQWFRGKTHGDAHEEDVTTYMDFLMMAWADGRLSQEETAFLAAKRQELRITESEARQAETDVRQQLRELLKNG